MRVSPCYCLFLHLMAFMDSASVLYQNITNWEGVSTLHWCLPLNPLLLQGTGIKAASLLLDSFPLFNSCHLHICRCQSVSSHLCTCRCQHGLHGSLLCPAEVSFARKLRTALPSFTWSSLVLSWC